MSSRRLDWKDDLLGAGLALGAMTLLLVTVGNLGYARDEGFYFAAADTYARWFDLLFTNPKLAFDRKTIDNIWRVNSEHPGLIKSLFALSNLLLQKKLHLFAMEGTSYRFPGIALAGAAVALVYRFGAEVRGRLAGVFAAAALFFVPAYFYHAHLACFDVPVVTMFLLVVYTYWKSMDRGGWAWPVATGISFGLALDTKHNAWFLPILFIVHFLIVVLRAKWTGQKVKPLVERAMTTFGCMAFFGPLVMYALWPWIWHDTLPRLRAYANFHLHHDYYNMEFLGQNYWKPPMPRLYAPVMTAATVPMITLALFFVGLAYCAVVEVKRLRGQGSSRKDDAGVFLLWLCAAGISYGAWVFPTTPIFGGTKHWMTAYPFFALFGGIGLSYLVTLLRLELRRMKNTSLRKAARGPIAAGALFTTAIAAPVAETWGSHPWGLSSYTPLVGGAKGAATLGLNRTFWGYTTGAVVDYLNREVPKNGTVYMHDTAWPAWEMLQKDGRLRKDIRGTGSVHEAMFALYHHEQHMLGQEYQAWVAYGTVAPDHIAGLDGVPVIWVYRKK
jgi:4-amino-4-deoxy-L-arabinose transferase-like glycosyltransferase